MADAPHIGPRERAYFAAKKEAKKAKRATAVEHEAEPEPVFAQEYQAEFVEPEPEPQA